MGRENSANQTHKSEAPSTRMLLMQTLGAAVFVLVLGFFCFISVIDATERRAAEDRIETTLSGFGDMTEWGVGNWLKHRVDELVFMERHYERFSGTDRSFDVFESTTLDDTFTFSYIGTADGEFHLWPPVAEETLVGFDPRVRPWYKSAVEQGGVALIAPYTPIVGDLTLSVAMPQLGENGEVEAVVGGDFPVKEMADFLRANDLHGLGNLFLVDRTGTIITYPDETKVFENVTSVFGDDVSVSEEIMRVAVAGDERLVTFQPIRDLPGADWYIGISIDLNAVYAPLHEFRVFAFIATVVTVLVLILALGWVGNTLLARPLDRARTQSEAANVAKSEFLANMSHEIRTPMNGVLGMVEVLGTTELDERQTEYIETIDRSGAALLTVINDILDFSKFEAGKMSLDNQAFDLPAVIDDVAGLLATSAREKHVEMIVRYAPGLPRDVVGDAGRLRQVITNLCGNAIKFTQDGYVFLDVNGEVVDDAVELVISIKDTGIGISDENLSRIFDEFAQAESSTTRRFGGTGLGLAICRRIVEIMGGQITVESEVDKGSTFSVHVSLPVGDESKTREEVDVDLSGVKVLAIDDLAVNRSILGEQLRWWDTDFTLISSGSEGLASLRDAAAKKEPYDIVLLDYQMPGMDGLEVARRIRCDESLGDVRIVVLSSADQDDIARQFQDARVDAFLMKPVRSAILRQVIAQVMTDRNVSDLKKMVASTAPEEFDVVATGKRILVAEDNQVNRMVIGSMLRNFGIQLIFAENGELAVNAYQEQSIDLILMDISMPVKDGVEATQDIRAIEAKTGATPTPIVALTAHAMEGDRDRFIDAGVNYYLSKPIRQDDLVRMLMQLGVLQRREEAVSV